MSLYVLSTTNELTSLLRSAPLFLPALLAAGISIRINERWKAILLSLRYHAAGMIFLWLLWIFTPNVVRSLLVALNLPQFSIYHPVFFSFWGVAFAWLVLFYSVRTHSFLARSRLLRGIGTISYSIYLSHWFILRAVEKLNIPNSIASAIFLSLCVLVSCLTYVFIEKPGMELGYSLSRKLRCFNLSRAHRNTGA